MWENNKDENLYEHNIKIQKSHGKSVFVILLSLSYGALNSLRQGIIQTLEMDKTLHPKERNSSRQHLIVCMSSMCNYLIQIPLKWFNWNYITSTSFVHSDAS